MLHKLEEIAEQNRKTVLGEPDCCKSHSFVFQKGNHAESTSISGLMLVGGLATGRYQIVASYAELPTGCLSRTSLVGDRIVTNSSADEG